jgi:hypothetical protein
MMAGKVMAEKYGGNSIEELGRIVRSMGGR